MNTTCSDTSTGNEKALYPRSTKKCPKCTEVKLPSFFYRRRQNKLSSWCKSCTNTLHRQTYQDTNRGKSARERERGWKRRGILSEVGYSFLVGDYERLFLAQKGKCAICRQPSSGYARAMAVDHDHITGKTRGLLCFNCNKGIGHFGDSENRLYLAAEYLRGGQ